MIRLAILALLLLVAFLIAMLPWWASLGSGVVFIALLYLGRQKLLESLFTLPFKAKGRALRGATATVHSVEPAAPPTKAEGREGDDEEEEDENEEDEDARRRFLVDVTITPSPNPGGPFTTWELGELMLTRPDAKPMDAGGDDDAAGVKKLEVFMDGGFQPDEGYKLPGSQRLRLLVSVKPGLDRLRFRYYFELFGEVRLPTPT